MVEVSCDVVSDTPCENDMRGTIVANVSKNELNDAMLYTALPTGNVRCHLCGRRCTISPGKRGYCGVRENRDGLLYSLVYGKACAWAVDPIEKKPFYHFFPGSESFSFSTVGCNFRCPWCLGSDTIIPIMKDGKIKTIKAADLDKFFEEKHSDLKGLKALTVKGWRRIIGISRKKTDEAVFEISTEEGRKTYLTKDHLVIAITNGRIHEKQVKALRAGDGVIAHEMTKKNLEGSAPSYTDKIVEMTEIESSHHYVYDLMLEGTDNDWRNHSFFCGDGILVHNCQNWEISQPNQIFGENLPPKKIVEMAKEAGAQGIAYTYTEPTIFMEYARDTAELARREGLYNVFVSNGYMTDEAIEEASKFLDAIRIDLKAFNPETYRKYLAADIEVVKHSIAEFNKRMHTEVINLIIPTVNDSDDEIRALSEWLKSIDPTIPLHFTAYYPANKFTIAPTPAETLQKARKIALDVGLHYVYTGNVPGDPGENTYCPNCDVLLIRRFGFAVLENRIKDGRCPGCGHQIKLITRLPWMK
jgi:pyruvate formate lyase activating enzyme